jgi:phospholipid/cholesterol/gamma-HCH transport system substrate-binding protein
VNQTRTELIVGIFVITGILCLGYLAIRLGKLEILGSGYVVLADFASVAGLKVGDAVEIAGVKIGRVDSIGLHDDRARVGLRVNDSVKLSEDTIASVRARGLIGDKFIVITPGGSDKVLGPGERIRETESPPDISEVIGKYLGGDLTSKSETKSETKKGGDK